VINQMSALNYSRRIPKTYDLNYAIQRPAIDTALRQGRERPGDPKKSPQY